MDDLTTLNVSVISIPVLVISEGELGILVVVRDPAEWRVVVETRVEDLVHYFLRLLSADAPHGQDGAEGAASDALLSGGGGGGETEVRDPNLKPAGAEVRFILVRLPDDASGGQS